MSTAHDDNEDLPFDIQTEIIKRVQDVKSLLRFRSVSKPWKSVIDSPKFIADYRSNNGCILAIYKIKSKHYLVSMVDDDSDSFPRRNSTAAVPLLADTFAPKFIGNSQGLFCFHIRYHYSQDVVVVWNPSIRKSVIIDDMPSCINFGVCPRTKDPKFVKINFGYHNNSAEIYTLSSGAWRSLSINLPDISDERMSFLNEDWYDDLCYHKAAVDGILYWHVYTTSYRDNRRRGYNRIITFDLASEEFGEVCLPDCLATEDNMRRDEYARPVPKLCISKRNESLVVLQYYIEGPHTTVHVWAMEEHGDSKLFTKLFTIEKHFGFIIKGFRMNGQPIIETRSKTEKIKKSNKLKAEIYVLHVYDPCTGQINNHDLRIDKFLYIMGVERETLLLLNQQ